MTKHRHTLPSSPGNFFTKNEMTVVYHPLCFSLFPQLKLKLNGSHFDALEVLEAEPQWC
jgi:hypothetical protein